MGNYDENLNNKIKISLQQAYDILNKDKEPEKKYELFDELACQYLAKGVIRDYPKVVAIYQYMMKLQPDRGAELEGKIASVEEEFIRKAKGAGSNRFQKVKEYKKRLEEFRGVENSEHYGESVRARLKGIEDLGIVEGQEELDEEGLQKRSEEVERIYMGIREFFIGEGGLIKDLISDCIKDLGGLPVIDKNGEKREVEYAIFGMGSMALGTMTPWSDMEFGILIEEGLSQTEEKEVKEYFRNLTSLLHIRVINFGETPLRMMGIEELNNFKLQDRSDKDNNWFYDELINPGFSFDGPHAHACKTPLGRQGFKGHQDFELIGTPEEILKFQLGSQWREKDMLLVQALWHTVLIMGSELLIRQCQAALNRTSIKEYSFEILRKDTEELNPFICIHDKKEGQILNVKKEIYRFLDRIIISLGDCLEAEGEDSWKVITHLEEKIDAKKMKNLQIALSIAADVRLRTYVNNKGQREELSVLSRYESEIDEFKKMKLLESVFYVKNLKILYRYYSVVLELSVIIGDTKNIKSLKNNFEKESNQMYDLLRKGLVYRRFQKYEDAICALEQCMAVDYTSNSFFEYKEYQRKDSLKRILAELYYIIGKHERALKSYEELITIQNSLGIGVDDYSKAELLNNIAITLTGLGRYEEALKYLQDSESIIDRSNYERLRKVWINIGGIYYSQGKYKEALNYFKRSLNIKGDLSLKAAIIENIGNIYLELSRFDEALNYMQKSLQMRCRIYKGISIYIARSLTSIGNVLFRMGDSRNERRYNNENLETNSFPIKKFEFDSTLEGMYEEALRYYKESLNMFKLLFKGDHPEIAASLSNLGNVLGMSGIYKKALEYQQESLNMRRRLYKKDHPDIALSLNNVGAAFGMLEIDSNSLKFHKESLEMYKRLIRANHSDINHPGIARGLMNVGKMYCKLGFNEEAHDYQKRAIEMFRKINKYDIAFVLALKNLGELSYSLDKNEEAIMYYKESLENLTRSNILNNQKITGHFKCDVLFRLGTTYGKLGSYQEALECYNKSLIIVKDIDKEDEERIACLKSEIGNMYYNLNQYQKALEFYEESLDIVYRVCKSNYKIIAMLLQNISDTYIKLGRYDEAISYTNRLLALHKEFLPVDNPNIEIAQQRLVALHAQNQASGARLLNFAKEGVAYFCGQNYNKAIEMFSKAIELSPSSELFYNRGRAYHEKGDLELAIKGYNKAIELNPKYAKALYQLGVCSKKQGDIVKAKDCFEKALKEDSKLEAALKALTELSKEEESFLINQDCSNYEKLIENQQVTMLLSVITNVPFKAYLRDSKNYIVDAVYKMDQIKNPEGYEQNLSRKFGLPFLLRNSDEQGCKIILKGVNVAEVADLVTQRYKSEEFSKGRTLH